MSNVIFGKNLYFFENLFSETMTSGFMRNVIFNFWPIFSKFSKGRVETKI